MGIKLDGFERNNMISVLEWKTNFSYEYLKSLSDEALEKLYKERVG
ncbi:BH0509 family protein [Cytobacillus sp. FJAT-54145]|uniref:BH0509 family protein n=1 Tax=Cytobacillus spartinae TaxID=3299023 RepID=A0ABW6KLJ5_9BACI